MKSKKGVSLVVLIITLIVMVIIVTVTISGIENVLKEAQKSEFVTELETIKDKAEEWYFLTGTLPIETGTEYTASQLKAKVLDSQSKTLLTNEISKNGDLNNNFFVVDLALMDIQTNERGKKQNQTDIFVIAENTLNIYYLGGAEIYKIVRFSVVDLVDENNIKEPNIADTAVNLNDTLNIAKSSNVWSNSLTLTIKNSLNSGETLTYSIGTLTAKQVNEKQEIYLNNVNLNSDEQQALNTNKYITVNRLKNGTVIESKRVNVTNLDMDVPNLGGMDIVNTSNASYNTVKINSTDVGNSGVKAIYYDYETKLVNGVAQSYYTDRNNVTEVDLINFGKITNDGTIKLAKDIKSIVAVAVDNAGNVSLINTYTITAE